MRDVGDPMSIPDIPGAGHRELGGFSGSVSFLIPCLFVYTHTLDQQLRCLNLRKLSLQSWSVIPDAKRDCRGLSSKISYSRSLW